MLEQMDEREVRYFGQEAAIALQNKAFIRVCEQISTAAMDALVHADPADFRQIAACQERVKCADEIGEALEAMTLRAMSLQAEEGPPAKDLN